MENTTVENLAAIIHEVQRLKIEPDEALLVNIPDKDFDDAQKERIEESIRQAFEGIEITRVVVAFGGIEFRVVKQGGNE